MKTYEYILLILATMIIILGFMIIGFRDGLKEGKLRCLESQLNKKTPN